MKKFLKSFTIKEILKFLVGGGSAVLTDFLIYYLLKGMINVDTAKQISFVSGAIVGFIINKFWTFDRPKMNVAEIIKYILLYAFSATVNSLTNRWIIDLTGIYFLAFLIATGCSTVINFLGQKFFVFKKF